MLFLTKKVTPKYNPFPKTILKHLHSSIYFLTSDITLALDWVKCEGRTNAGGAAEVIGVANIAMAEEGTQLVNTLAILTQVWQNLTLVDICGNKESHSV